MSSDEERLEELLRSVTNEQPQGEQSALDALRESAAQEVIPAGGEASDSVGMPTDEDIPAVEAIPSTEETHSEELSESGQAEETPQETEAEASAQEMPENSERGAAPFDPLAFMDLSEDEVDKILKEEKASEEIAAGGEPAAETEAPLRGESAAEFSEESLKEGDMDLADLLGAEQGLSEIQELLDMSDRHEEVSDAEDTDGSVNGADAVTENAGESEEETDAEPADEEETEQREKKKKEKAKKEKVKKEKVKKEKKPGKQKQKDENHPGFLKHIGQMLFGSDADEITESIASDDRNAENMAIMSELEQEDAAAKEKEEGKKGKKKAGKGKKEKKGKDDAIDPKKEAKEREKREKKAQKARKKAEQAEKAAELKRTEKKLPRKKVIVWAILCASILTGILLVNSLGMDMLNLIEARNAYDRKDYQSVYEHLNGRKLSEEDQTLYAQASVILHLQHVKEAYENHLKLGKPLKALEDLIQGVEKYQEFAGQGSGDLMTPESSDAYQQILALLRDNYGLSETDALDIAALEDDYDYSVQMEAIVNGAGYQAGGEENAEADDRAEMPELEDMLPEEEEYFNGSGN